MAEIKIEIPSGYFCTGCTMLKAGNHSQIDWQDPKCKLYDCDLASTWKIVDMKSQQTPYKLPMCMEKLLSEVYK